MCARWDTRMAFHESNELGRQTRALQACAKAPIVTLQCKFGHAICTVDEYERNESTAATCSVQPER